MQTCLGVPDLLKFLYPQYYFGLYCEMAKSRLQAFDEEFKERLHREEVRLDLVSQVMFHT